MNTKNICNVVLFSACLIVLLIDIITLGFSGYIILAGILGLSFSIIAHSKYKNIAVFFLGLHMMFELTHLIELVQPVRHMGLIQIHQTHNKTLSIIIHIVCLIVDVILLFTLVKSWVYMFFSLILISSISMTVKHNMIYIPSTISDAIKTMSIIGLLGCISLRLRTSLKNLKVNLKTIA